MLELKNISYSVNVIEQGKKQKKEILKNISIKFDTNKYYCITGPNGSGKSTLAKIIMGIVKPTGGNIYFDGKDITNLSITERAKLGISFAFQQPVKFKGLTVKDLLTLASGTEIDMNTACKYLSDVGLCARDYISREVDGSLSGGELKRIEIAQMVARKGKVTIFDEPEAGIDLWSFNSLIDVFGNLSKVTKGTTIIISHQERIINFADTLILLENGKIKNVGAPAEVMKEITGVSRQCKVMEAKDVR